MHSHEFGKSVLCMLTSNGPLRRPFWPNSSQFANFVHFCCFMSRESMRQWRLFNNALEPDPEPQSRHNGIRIPNGELFGLGFWSGRNLGRGLSAQAFYGPGYDLHDPGQALAAQVFLGQGQNPGQALAAQGFLGQGQNPGQAQGSLDPWQDPGQALAAQGYLGQGQNPGQALAAQGFLGQGQNPGQAQGSLDPWQDPGQALAAQGYLGQGQNPGQAQSSLDPWQDPGQAQGSLDPWQNPGQDSSEGFPQRDFSEIATGGGSMAGEYRLFKITVDGDKWQYVFEPHLDLIVLHLTLAEAMNYLEDPDEFDEFEEV